jgi:Ca2+-binding EF-hand superfamily protein
LASAQAEGVHLSLDEVDIAFSQIDADADGFISKQELIDYQSKVNAPIVPPVDPQPPA